ncbi:MAG: helix-turn-helix domain-containing protein [Candidatus Pacearchaeota archaeon]
MAKLTKEQIEEIKRLKESGKSIKELAELFGVSEITIKWHVDEDFRRKWMEYQNNYRKREKLWLRESNRKYQREYHRNRYHSDKEFREKQIMYSKEYQNFIREVGGKQLE